MLGLKSKQEAERIQIGVDYSCWLKAGAMITLLAITIEPWGEAGGELGLYGAYLSPDGRVVHVLVDGGSDGHDYKLTLQVTSTLALVKEDEVIVRVEEI